LARTRNQSISGATTFMNRITSITTSGYDGLTVRISTMNPPISAP
jgi:hypothetical protein